MACLAGRWLFSNAATGIAVVFGEAFASQAEQAFQLVFPLKSRCLASPCQVRAGPQPSSAPAPSSLKVLEEL